MPYAKEMTFNITYSNTPRLVIALTLLLYFGPFAFAQTESHRSTKDAPEKQNNSSKSGSSKPDSANQDIVKSWTTDTVPGAWDQRFLDGLNWQEQTAGQYNIRTGRTYGKCIAAVQFFIHSKLVMTEYTPPGECVTTIDPKTGHASDKVRAIDADNDGTLEIAFLHEKMNDPDYHMYSVYALKESAPKLLWKSAGTLGDWVHRSHDEDR